MDFRSFCVQPLPRLSWSQRSAERVSRLVSHESNRATTVRLGVTLGVTRLLIFSVLLCRNGFQAIFDSAPATNIQSQLFSVGFVVSGLSPSHVGRLADLSVLTAWCWPPTLPVFPEFRFLFALCSQKILRNRTRLAQAKSHIYPALAHVVVTASFSNALLPKSITGTRR